MYIILIKNIALKRIPNHCTLNKVQHQTHVLLYHWLIASCNQSKLLARNCKFGNNYRVKCIP